MNRILLIVAILSTSALAADPPEGPQSPAAVSAIKDYEKACKTADDAYKQARLVAEKKLLEKLKPALAIATKAGNLKEANTITAEMATAQSRIADLNRPEADTKTFVIYANKAWQPTIELLQGQKVRVHATGKWCCAINNRAAGTSGPDGLGELGYLEGRIGAGEVFKIGTRKEFDVSAAGLLQMEMRDSVRDDNDGSLVVAVTVLNPNR